MSSAIQMQVILKHETCCNCGIPFAIPDYLQRRRREDRANFYCPNGHGQHYLGETEAERLQAELNKAKSDLEWQRSQRQTAEASLVKTQKKLRKIETRVARGVCPCCNRTFINVQRHMHTKHPEFVEASSTGM